MHDPAGKVLQTCNTQTTLYTQLAHSNSGEILETHVYSPPECFPLLQVIHKDQTQKQSLLA
jgi:3-hydroxyacyl-CoA dehydrogenase